MDSGEKCKIGLIGLGVMGRNLLLNMADHGFKVSGYDNDPEKIKDFQVEAGKNGIRCTDDLKEFISTLHNPKIILMLVPAGAPVDSVINSLSDHISQDDLIIDGGNSYFKDTNLRSSRLKEKGIHYIGMGISGGEEGARHGPSIMPGGPREVYERVRPVLEAVAAKVDGDPCVTWLGPGSSGHFVKMVHNGIEYGLMQLIAESYSLLKLMAAFSDEELQKIYNEWNNSELNGFLIEITANIFGTKDSKTGKKLVDEILDVARQKGTGMWTTQSAMELQVPIPTIDIAETMRNLSVYEEFRFMASKIFSHPNSQDLGNEVDRKSFVSQIRQAVYASMLLTYIQGFSLLMKASEKYEYDLDPVAIARIWRGGCIIRSSILNDIMSACQESYVSKKHKISDTLGGAGAPILLLNSSLSQKINKNIDILRQLVCKASSMGIPVPGLMASLSYVDALSSTWLPANLIQAQRDYFGAHTYERIDAKGTFHTEWTK